MKVYYAHSVSLYNTPQEARDVALLEALGFEVENPNATKHQEGYDKYKKQEEDQGRIFPSGMLYFRDVVNSCDAVAFRSFPDGKIGSGVGMEVKWAADKDKPVFELPNLLGSRFLTRGDTKEYLRQLGLR